MAEYKECEAVIAAIDERIKQIGYEDNPLVLSIRHSVRDVPAADVVPVVKGKWTNIQVLHEIEEEWQSARCSECGKYHTTPYMYYYSNYNYCPNCGARLENVE